MQKQKTIYQLILDKSGSMSDCIDNTLLGFNDQITKIRQLEREFPEQEISIGLTTFNDEVTNHYFKVRPAEVQMLTRNSYRPSGGTALYDAIGITTRSLEDAIDAPTDEVKTTVVVVILTDGFENSSRLHRLKDIRNMIAALEETGNWTFSFIGATLDAEDVAERMAIKRQNSFSFSKQSMKNEVWDKVSDSMHSYLDKKRGGKDLSILFDK